MATTTLLSGVIFEDGAYFVRIGKLYNGTAATLATDDFNFRCIIENVKVNATYQKTRVSNCVVRNRYHSLEKSITMTVMVPQAGTLFVEGYEAGFKLESYDTSATITELVGVITEASTEWTAPGGATKQTITVDFNADFTLTAP